jgi:hypothetical protein
MPDPLCKRRRPHAPQVDLPHEASVHTPSSNPRPHKDSPPTQHYPLYIHTGTRSHALEIGPAKTDNSDYRGGVAVLSLSQDYSVSKSPLPPNIQLPADFEHQVLPCTLKHIPTSTDLNLRGVLLV